MPTAITSIRTAADQLIAERFGSRARRLEPLAAGQWSQAFSLQLDGEDVVLRMGAYGEDFAKDEIVANRVVPELPVPRILHRGETENLSFAISQRAVGIAFDDATAEQLEAVLPAFFTTLDLIAATDISDTKGYGGWQPDGTAPRTSWADFLLSIEHETPRVPWRTALAASATGMRPFERGLAALEHMALQLPDKRQLVHADLLNRNVLIDGDRVTAVLDWGNAQYGDRLYDAAWLIYWWPSYPQWGAVDIRSRLRAHWRETDGVPDDVQYRLLAYQLHIGLDSMAYCAFTQRWDDVARAAETVLTLSRTTQRI